MMKKKLVFSIVIIMALFLLPASSDLKRVLILDSQNGEPYLSARLALIDELKDQGYIDGKNIEISYYSADGKEGRAKRILQTYADDNYDVIFINGTLANIAAYKFGFNNSRYKFVFCSVTDPVGVGIVEKLDSPTNSNFTGVAYPVSVEKRLSFLMEVLPDARKIGVIYADMPQSHSYNRWLDEALQKNKFKHLEIIYRKVEYVPSNEGYVRMSRLAEKHVKELDSLVDVFLTPSDQLGTHREYAEVVTANSNKPLMGLSENEIMADWGAHFAYYMDQDSAGRTAARMIIRILKGEPIKAIIPVTPQGEYGINMKRSQAIGLEYPRSIIDKARGNIVY